MIFSFTVAMPAIWSRFHESWKMSDILTEEEMRKALFGSVIPSPNVSIERSPEPASMPALPKRASTSKRLSPKLRVTLHVTKTYEGPQEAFVDDANTLSTLVAEAEAKAAAKKKKFRYFELVSVESV